MKARLTILTTTLSLALFRTAVYAQNFTSPTEAKSLSGIFATIARLINLLLGLSGIMFIVTIFMMAIKFATSVDDPKGLEAAKATGTNAIIGFVVVIGFFWIFNAILSAFGFAGDSGLMNPAATGANAINNFLHWFTTTESVEIQYPNP